MKRPSCPPFKGCLVQILPRVSGAKTTARPGGSRWGEAVEGRVLCSSGQCEEVKRQDPGRRSNPGSWHLLPAVHVHGVSRREARVHQGYGNLLWDRWKAPIHLLRSAELLCRALCRAKILLSPPPPTGADETVVATLKFSNNRMAMLTWSSALKLRNEAIIVGTKGAIRVGSHFILHSEEL